MSQTIESDHIAVCDDCGQPYAAGNWHTCSSDRVGNPRSEERERLRRLDDGDPDDVVLVAKGGRTRAYHEPAGDPDLDADPSDLQPACGSDVDVPGQYGNERNWQPRTREWAKTRTNKFPCRDCHDLDQTDA